MSDIEAHFLVGATASGKTAVAQHLAEEHGFAILSVDSMLLYRGMDVGTAKPTLEERGTVEYGGLDLFDPSEDGSVWQYRRHAMGFLRHCRERGVPVIAVGGSGLYVKALTHGLRNVPGAGESQRRHWEELAERDGVVALRDELRQCAPELLDKLDDPHNARRLVRALESCASPSADHRDWAAVASTRPLAGLRRTTEDLNVRIASRVHHMLEGGLLAEADRLRKRATPLSRTARQAIGYAEAFAVLDGELELPEAIERIARRTRRLVKKQRTWFRHQSPVEWIDVDEGQGVTLTAERVREVWRQYGATGIAEK